MTLFDARHLARGWLSVALASAKDSDRPALDRTVAIEAYLTGIRVTATDSYMLLTTWIPNLDNEFEPSPSIDEAPYTTAVAMDPHGRGKGFLAHALHLAKSLEDVPLPVSLDLGVIDQVDETDQATLAGLEAAYVKLELPEGAERLRLRTYEGLFPSWRPIARFTAAPSTRIRLSPDIVTRLAKVEKYQPGVKLSFEWAGENAAARFSTHMGWPEIEGIVMPCRWDFDADRPRDDAPTPDDAASPDQDEVPA